jgi:hypothetical protein
MGLFTRRCIGSFSLSLRSNTHGLLPRSQNAMAATVHTIQLSITRYDMTQCSAVQCSEPGHTCLSKHGFQFDSNDRYHDYQANQIARDALIAPTYNGMRSGVDTRSMTVLR